MPSKSVLFPVKQKIRSRFRLRTFSDHPQSHECTAKPTLLKKVSWIRQLQAEALFPNGSSFFIVAPIVPNGKSKIMPSLILTQQYHVVFTPQNSHVNVSSSKYSSVPIGLPSLRVENTSQEIRFPPLLIPSTGV